MKKSIKISKYSFINMIILLFSVVVLSCCSLTKIIEDFDNSLLTLSWIINIVYILNIYYIYKIKKNILDFNLIFITFLFLFCNGQIFLYSLGLPSEQLLIFKVCNDGEIIRATLYFYFCFMFFLIGSSFFIKKDNDVIIENNSNNTFIKVIRIVSILFILVSIVPYSNSLLSKVKISLMYGYSALYTDAATTNNGIIGYISKLFIPSLFMLIYSLCKLNKKTYKIIGLGIIVIAFFNLMIGARGEALSMVVMLLTFNSSFIKKINGKEILKVIPIILVIMIIIPVVASIRSVENKNIEMIINEIKNKVTIPEENFIVETIAELGGTMYAFVLTERVVPSVENYKYGESYLASFLMLIPSQFLGGYSFAHKAALDIWLQQIHKMSYGPGYSLIAETYYNFGYYGGVIFTGVIGMFFSILFNISSKNDNKKELLKLLSFIFLYNSLIVVRFPFHNTIRNIVFIYIMPYILINTIYATIKKKS